MSGEVLDKLRDKGEDTCQKFIVLLKQQCVLGQYPRLRDVFTDLRQGISFSSLSPLSLSLRSLPSLSLSPFLPFSLSPYLSLSLSISPSLSPLSLSLSPLSSSPSPSLFLLSLSSLNFQFNSIQFNSKGFIGMTAYTTTLPKHVYTKSQLT